MLIRTYVPQNPLAAFVDYMWYFEGYNPADTSEITLPDGSIDLVIDLKQDTIRLRDRLRRDSSLTGAVLIGPHSEFYVIDTSLESAVIGIRFKPGGIRPFVSMPLTELHNMRLPLDLLWGNESAGIRDKLLETDSTEGRFRELERWLISLAVRPFTQHPAVRFALDEFQSSPCAGIVGKVVDRTHFSHKHFNHLFKEEIGLTPKRLFRLHRFQRALCVIDDGRNMDWAALAVSCGYYDQAHFIKDFRDFSGLNPSDYRKIEGRHHNHVAVTP